MFPTGIQSPPVAEPGDETARRRGVVLERQLDGRGRSSTTNPQRAPSGEQRPVVTRAPRNPAAPAGSASGGRSIFIRPTGVFS
jgi:hypothetical protein